MISKDTKITKKQRTVFEEQQDIFEAMERLLNFLIKKNEEIFTRCKLEEQKDGTTKSSWF